MSLTIYTVSDPATIGSAMQAMAMFFGQEDQVGTAIKTGLMLSLIFILAQGVTRNGLRLDVMLVQLIVVWAMFMPKTTVTIEQFDNAAPPRVVDNIPYAIALPASIAGAFALYMTRNIEATMVNVDGDYLSISGASHPFNPARALMAITMCPSDPMGCADQNLVETMRLAARFCTNGEFTNIKFSNEPNVLEAFASKMTLDAQVIIYDSTNPYIPGGGGGRIASCQESAQYLKDVAELEKTGDGIISTSMGGLAARSEVKKYGAVARAEDKQTRSWNEALQDINKLRDANSKMDSLAFANVTLYSLADALKTNANAPIDQAITIRKDSGLFEWAKAESTQSMLVSTTAPKFMDILFFVFIASTPIVMFIVAANPSGGLKVAGSYALFGMWTQSWIPMMAIIMSWYQGEIKNISSPETFTPEYMAFYMRHVYTSTIAASNMMQQAPYIMFAIMTGSMFALSGMVSKAMPSKGSSAGALGASTSGAGASGDPLNPSPKSVIPGAGMYHAITGGQSVLASGDITSSKPGMVGDASTAIPGLPTLSASGAVQSGASLQSQRSAAVRQQVQSQAQQAYTELAQTIKSAGDKIGGQELASRLTKAGISSTYDSRTGTLSNKYGTFEVGSGQKNSTGQTAAAKVELGAQVSTGAKLEGGLSFLGQSAKAYASTSLTAAASLAGAVTEAVSQDVSMTNNKGIKTDSTIATGNTLQVGQGSEASNGKGGSKGSEFSETASRAKSLQQTFSKLASQTDALDKSDTATAQAGQTAGAQIGLEAKGGSVATNWGAMVSKRYSGGATGNDGEAINRVQDIASPSLSADQRQRFRDAVQQTMANLDAQGQTTTLGRDQVAMAAAFSVLGNMASEAATPQDKLSAQIGMANLAKAAGEADMTSGLQAVKAGLDKVADVEKNISAMEKNIAPTVADAVKQGDAHLGAQAQTTFQADVDARIAASKAVANNLFGSAKAGVKDLTQEGAKAQDTAEADVIKARNQQLGMQPLMKALDKGMENQSALPVRGDIGQMGSGNNTSYTHFFTGKQEDGQNNGVLGASGAGSVIPPKTIPSMVAGGVTEVKSAASGTKNLFSNNTGNGGGTSGAVAMVKNSASSVAGNVPTGGSAPTGSSPTSSSNTVVVQNNTSDSLPTLGVGGGLNLGAPNGPGGGGTPSAPQAIQNPKPYAGRGGAKEDTSANKTIAKR